MFWNHGKLQAFDANQKYKFVIKFQGLGVWAAQDSNSDKSFAMFAKKIDAPKINFEFERAYANEYVNYFQNGSIHWEPINITFADFCISNNNELVDLKKILNTYIHNSFITGAGSDGLTIEPTSLNRTTTIDLPVFCTEMRIVTDTISNTSLDYPTLNEMRKFTVKDINDIRDKYLTISANSYRIYKPRISKVDFGSFDYSSDDINEISITVIPEWCSFVQETASSNSTINSPSGQ